MNNFCYTLLIRQRTCENGIAKNYDNVYTNITPDTEIPLSFGYSIRFVSASENFATIELRNELVIPNLIFNIPSGVVKLFDLPVESGNLKVYISATSINCSNTIVCSAI